MASECTRLLSTHPSPARTGTVAKGGVVAASATTYLSAPTGVSQRRWHNRYPRVVEYWRSVPARAASSPIFRLTAIPMRIRTGWMYCTTRPSMSRMWLGLSVGTRPDCVAQRVLDLLCSYRDQGYEVWLELGLQSAFDTTLERVKRGHGFAEYRDTLLAARQRNLQVCTHLIAGLPGETAWNTRESLIRVLDLGTDGLKIHPLHVVKGTALANDWRRGGYRPLSLEQYVDIAADLVEMTPPEILFHRVTGTASRDILLAPGWCAEKWRVLNAITQELHARHSRRHRALLGGQCNQ